ncbi:MAG: hypothetical protein ACXVEF_18235 [Polyangiales bacterium]
MNRRTKLKLTPPKLGFVIGTRAALAVGIGLLLSEKLQSPLRRKIGLGLVAFGAATTIPALRTLQASAR